MREGSAAPPTVCANCAGAITFLSNALESRGLCARPDVVHQEAVGSLLQARQKVRTMMAKGMSLDAIRKEFNMSEYQGWDRENHFEWLAETLWRELQG